VTSSALLPALRQELTLLPAPKGDDGERRWFLFDPVKNAFHVLTRQAVDILKGWRAETPEAALKRINKSHPDWEIDQSHLKDMTAFLYQQNLTLMPPIGNADIFARQEQKSRKPLLERVMHASLFFRLPLFQPHNFLAATSPYIAFLFKTKSWLYIALLGVIGLIFTARQWDQFLATFIYFFTLEGFLFYALTLTVIKVLHELGHAYTAHHFGARVPIMGLAFLLMFPVLYTDTTDAWRLTSRLCGFQNMQESGFALGRWHMRKTLWGLNTPKPSDAAPRRVKILLAYAYATWAYRLFLFFAIGMLAYNFLPKPFGLLFLGFILSSFIAGPVGRELKHLSQRGRNLFSTRRARITLGLGLALLLVFFTPWQSRITAPAIIKPALQTHIYPLTAAHIDYIHVDNGDLVLKGDLLFTLSSEELTFRRVQSEQRLSLLTAQLKRRAANLHERRESIALSENYAAERLRLDAIETEIKQLVIYAPHDGVVSGLLDAFHPKRYIKPSHQLLTLSSIKAQKLTALPKEADINRIKTGRRFVFISADSSAPKMTGRVTSIAPTSQRVITEKILTSVAGGPVAVNPDARGRLIAHVPVFKLSGQTEAGLSLNAAQRGVVTLEATPQSPASKLWRSIMRVFIREADF